MFNEEYYTKLAILLNNVIPVSWKKIALHAEVGEDSISTYFYYLIENGEYLQGGAICDDYDVSNLEYQEFLINLVETIKELNNDYGKNGQEKWNSMTFLLDSDGTFNIDYSYDDLSNSSARQRRKNWLNKYLNN
ncbi:MAG: immunity protein YezG family protein [Anaerofustis sp.]